ncbi:MAG: NAD-binding protein [Bacteroidales bacterium]|nr:NAD-binding protein [Bacteroidales bacterium]
MKQPVVLCGLGKVGWRVLEFLKRTGDPVIVIDTRAEANDPRLVGVTLIVGDCRNEAILEQAGASTARAVLIVTSDDLANVSAALTVRRMNPDCRIVVRMFNQNLLASLGSTVRNTAALSVSALMAPMLALAAVTGDSLGAFHLDVGSHQIAEIPIEDGSPLVGTTVTRVTQEFGLLILAHLPAAGSPLLLQEVAGAAVLHVDDRLIVCGSPDRLEVLLDSGRGEFLSVRWAGRIRRLGRTVYRTLRAIDLPVKIGFTSLFLVLFGSTLVFRFLVGSSWADGVYETVSLITTNTAMHGEGRPPWVKLFLSGLRLAGAALFAGFTAIFTNYLIRARLGIALEASKVPDRGHIVVCGLGNVGYRCVQELTRLGRSVVAIEQVNDNPFAATVRRMGVPVIIGDATVLEVLRQARVDTARAVIAAVESELANLEIALLVRSVKPDHRVVVRLNEPDFARSVREAADIRYTVSASAVAAPAFVSALYGDRVHTLFNIAGQMFAAVEFDVQPDDLCLYEQTLFAVMVDYGLLPVAVFGQAPFAEQGIPRQYRLKSGDRFAAVMALPDLERLLRREQPPHCWSVVIESHRTISAPALLPIVRTTRNCTQEEAEALLQQPQFILADHLTRGTAEELVARLDRERVTTRIIEE